MPGKQNRTYSVEFARERLFGAFIDLIEALGGRVTTMCEILKASRVVA